MEIKLSDKKYVFILTILLSLILYCSNIQAKEIISVGYGESIDDAQRDAMRNAIEDAIGTMVNSETLVESNVLVKDEIYAKAKGFIDKYIVLEKRKTNDDIWFVKLKAHVNTEPDSKLMNKLTKLGIIEVKLRDPKIAVIIAKAHSYGKIPAITVENAIARKLIEVGFSKVTDPNLLILRQNNLAAMSIEEIKKLTNQLNLDFLIIGEVFSKNLGDIGKFLNTENKTNIISCKAALAVKIFIAKTGETIATQEAYGTAIDLDNTMASQKALQIAGESMGEYITEKLLSYGSQNKQNLSITILVNDFHQVNDVTKALRNIKGVESATISDYNSGKGSISLKYSGTPQSLYNYLHKACKLELNLKEITYNTITISTF